MIIITRKTLAEEERQRKEAAEELKKILKQNDLSNKKQFINSSLGREKPMNTSNEQTQSIEVPVLAKVVKEDDGWNIVAFDLPIVAFGKSLDAAQGSFEYSLLQHVRVSQEMGNLIDESLSLLEVFHRSDFWKERVKPGVIIQRFSMPVRIEANILTPSEERSTL